MDQLGSDWHPVTPDALEERLRRLRNVLIAARVARATLGVSLARVRAAAGFMHSRASAARQKFATPTGS
jgi:hypothetical protein